MSRLVTIRQFEELLRRLMRINEPAKRRHDARQLLSWLACQVSDDLVEGRDSEIMSDAILDVGTLSKGEQILQYEEVDTTTVALFLTILNERIVLISMIAEGILEREHSFSDASGKWPCLAQKGKDPDS